MNIRDIVMKKIAINEKKYPIEKESNTAREYSELRCRIRQ